MNEITLSVRLAADSDANELCALDAIAQHSAHRQAFIRRSIAAARCYIAQAGSVAGYAVLEYSFYEYGFVSMLVVHADWRRRGVGTALMQYLESICRTEKLFTSTNLSNLPMQSLLARLGYRLSGVIHDLDEGDPELVYVKHLRVGLQTGPQEP